MLNKFYGAFWKVQNVYNETGPYSRSKGKAPINMGCLRKSKNGSHENESSGAAYKGARKGNFKFPTKTPYQLKMKFLHGV